MAGFIATAKKYWKAITGASAGVLALLVTVPTDLLDPKLAAWVSVAVAVLGVIAGPSNKPKPDTGGTPTPSIEE